jgi:hypothetical protein
MDMIRRILSPGALYVRKINKVLLCLFYTLVFLMHLTSPAGLSFLLYIHEVDLLNLTRSWALTCACRIDIKFKIEFFLNKK